MVCWCEGLLPMTISEEESNWFCSCHLLNCDEGQGQWSITDFWYTVNGARQTKKKKVNPAGYRTRVARFIVGRASHFSTKASRKGGDTLVLLISLGYIWIHKVAVYVIMAISWGAQSWAAGWIKVYTICYIHGHFHSPTFTAHHVHRLLSWNFSARKVNLGRDNNARIRTIPAYRDWSAKAHVQSKITSKNSQKSVQKHFSNEMKIHFFIEDTHLPKKISKCISSHLITRTANEKPR
jgi:hypothetical protein